MTNKVKHHLKHYGKRTVETTPNIVYYWWRQLNSLIFNSILIKPKVFHCRDFYNNDYGWTSTYYGATNVEIGIRRNIGDRYTFLSVLVHEMVHQYQWTTYKELNHGKTFFEWKDVIYVHTGLLLTETIE